MWEHVKLLATQEHATLWERALVRARVFEINYPMEILFRVENFVRLVSCGRKFGLLNVGTYGLCALFNKKDFFFKQ